MSWPDAFGLVGVAWAVVALFIAFFWAITRDGK